MAMQLQQFLTEGIAQLSYLVGDSASHTAAVIDPRRDVELYLHAARTHGLSITHIFETHIHADFVSGARDLAARIGGGAAICASVEGGADYGFDVTGVRDGDRFEFGKLLLTARHTPGHTPEHLSYELSQAAEPDRPWAVFSGDTLFADSAGRPDLLGSDQTEALVRQLHHSLREYYLRLDDGVLVYPGHGHGSPCGADIGDRLATTIGEERRHNRFLQLEGLEAFREHALGTAPPVPHYYPRMKQVNARGPEVMGDGPHPPPLPPREFDRLVQQREAVVIDTRTMLAFGGGHIPGSLNIGAKPLLSVWAGWMLDPERPIALVVEDDAALGDVLNLFTRTGYDRFAGYLAGGIEAWVRAGLPVSRTEQIPVHEIAAGGHGRLVLDVRSPSEWRGGHVPGAQHAFLGNLREELNGLDRDRPLATYCGSGYRSSLAASWLRAAGFEDVANIPGSWTAWQAARLPVEKPGEPAEK